MTSAQPSTAEAVVFWICAILAVSGGLGLILSRRAVHSALWLALTMISLAVLYIVNAAPFLGMVQIIVYTGAVMMLFLFVLMVVGVDSSDSLVETLRGQRVAGILLAVGMGILLVLGIGQALTSDAPLGLETANDEYGGNVQGLARLLFSDYLLAFEIVAALLIVGAVGALVLAHRERYLPKRTQRDLSQAAVRAGLNPAPQPAPGVYARHNAVDTPGLLPDGSVADISVPGPLRARGDLRPIDTDAVAETHALASGEAAFGPELRPVADDPGTSPGEPA
ncbi:MAG: NADH-quinone oxidoreductase subunit J [Candidatus Nanopelagicales bacterium]